MRRADPDSPLSVLKHGLGIVIGQAVVDDHARSRLAINGRSAGSLVNGRFPVFPSVQTIQRPEPDAAIARS